MIPGVSPFVSLSDCPFVSLCFCPFVRSCLRWRL